jgi:hypothetical protein
VLKRGGKLQPKTQADKCQLLTAFQRSTDTSMCLPRVR